MNYKSIFCKSFLFILTIISFSSCNMEDDIQEIFIGKTWYLVNFFTTSNWKDENISKAVYRTDDEEGIAALNAIKQQGTGGFYINFRDNYSFTAKGAGNTFGGNWEVDGKKNILTMQITQGERPNGNSAADKVSRDFYDLISNSGFYIGNTIYLKIFQSDKKVFMQFTKDK